MTGTQTGCVYRWAFGGEQCLHKYDALHQGPVHDMFVNEEYIVTGGKDGKVHFHTEYFERAFTVDMARVVETVTDAQGKPLCCYDGKTPCVKAVFLEGTQLLVGTKGSEIFEFDMSTETSWRVNRRIVTQGHAAATDEKTRTQTCELRGLTAHPFLPQFVTAGDDKTLRVFDMYQRRQIAVRNVSSKARSATYSPDGTLVACGFQGGGFIVFETATGNELAAKKHRREEISDLKFSPSGRWLAVASPRQLRRPLRLRPRVQARGRVQGPQLLRHARGLVRGRAVPAEHLRGLRAAVLGDPEVPGGALPGGAERHALGLVDVRAGVARAGHLAEARGRRGRQRRGAQRGPRGCRGRGRPRAGEAVPVPQRRRARGVSRVPRARAESRGMRVCVQRRVPHNRRRERPVRVPVEALRDGRGGRGDDQRGGGGDVDGGGGLRGLRGDQPGDEDGGRRVRRGRAATFAPRRFRWTRNPTPIFLKGPASTRARASRSCRARRPSSRPTATCASRTRSRRAWRRRSWSLRTATRAHDARDNLFYSARGEVVYHAAALGVVYDRETNTQKFLADVPTAEATTGHADDIVCLARHPTGSIFATGEVGRNPRVIVWSSDEVKKPLAILQGFLKKAVVSCTFSRDGALLCAVGADSNHSLVVYRWQTGTMLASSKGSPEKIVSVNWSPFQDYVVTCGIKHLAFWSTSPFESRKAVLNKKGKMQTMLCSCFPGPDTTVVGTQDGSLYLFKGYQLATNMRKAHAVTHAVHATRDMVISGGKEGKVKFWTVDLMQCLKEVVISHPQAIGSCIKSMHLSGSMLLLGTRSGEIYEMDTTSYSHELLLQGHGYGTIWGLATHPSEHQMVTVGDDCTVRIWDLAARRMVMVRDLGARGRSAAYHPDGSQIAVGLAGGGLVVLSADSLDTVHAKKDREEPIHEVKYSPNGQFLAAGSHDNYIDVYDVSKQYGRMGVCKGHASFVRHVDWSTDSTILQSNSGDFEQMFWEVPSGKHIAFPADARNVDWATWTCVAGWPVQGIMPRYSMGADVLSCDRSHTRTIVAAGDSVRVPEAVSVPGAQGRGGAHVRRAFLQGDAGAVHVRRHVRNHRGGGHDHHAVETGIVKIRQ